ncbi:hypothetical protein Lumi_023 [Xylophilus phage Lumi]|nr:hypothetical protein Lumi_023 [Xylophilus phage Lumi]
MSYYEEYKDLLGRKYVAGENDCYGLVKDYYKKIFDLELTDYARPEGFADFGIDLIVDNLLDEGFQMVDVPTPNLMRGDGLLFRVNGSTLTNHVGVYVGNGYFIHHLWNGLSNEEAMTTKWRGRVSSVVRHPDVYTKARVPTERLSIMDFIPEHIKAIHNATFD